MKPKSIAQSFCWGRTHYFDDDTLRFFGARVVYAEVVGEALRAVERLPVGWQGPRSSSAVHVDVSGTVTRGPMRASTRRAMADFEQGNPS